MVQQGKPVDIREPIREEDEDEEADRSQVPLLALKRADTTVVSHATETTCLSIDYTPERRSRRRRDSLHSHDDSSLHSLDDSSGGAGDEDERSSAASASSRSLRGHDDDDTGICHADHQMLNEADAAHGTSSAGPIGSPTVSCTSSNSLNNNSINNNSSLGNNNNNSGRGTSLPAVVT